MPKPCKFSSLDSSQKRLPWTTRKVILLNAVFGLMLQAGDAERFRQALGFKAWILFFRGSEQGSCFTAIEEEGVELELACEADGVAPPEPV